MKKERKPFIKPTKVVLKERYYYTDGISYFSSKTPIEGMTEITKEQYELVTKSVITCEPFNPEIASIEAEINNLKHELAKTDYQAIKYAEGWLTEEEYAPIKAERQAMRNRINELEGML
jgi:hypothetical protein